MRNATECVKSTYDKISLLKAGKRVVKGRESFSFKIFHIPGRYSRAEPPLLPMVNFVDEALDFDIAFMALNEKNRV